MAISMTRAVPIALLAPFARRMSSSRQRAVVFGAIFVGATLLSACASHPALRRGDAHAATGAYRQALAAYEQGLAQSPEHPDLLARVAQVRRLAVQEHLKQSTAALAAGEIPKALEHAVAAQALPLNLEDVVLMRRVDEAVRLCVQRGEQRVQAQVALGQQFAALRLAEQILQASRGDAGRQGWVDTLRQRAVAYYAKRAQTLAASGWLGAAVAHGAMAASAAGAPTHLATAATATAAASTGVANQAALSGLWERFERQGACRHGVSVRVLDEVGDITAAGLVAPLHDAVSEKAALEPPRYCAGEGQPLPITVRLQRVQVQDSVTTETVTVPRPGVSLVTDEEVTEMLPYVVLESVTHYTTRTVLEEKRDCAPRPGKERGCRTWTEEKVVRTPHQKQALVTKEQAVRYRRPLPGPFDSDQVLATYEQQRQRREVVLEGTMDVDGVAPDLTHRFRVRLLAMDTGHPALRLGSQVQPADDLAVTPVEAILDEAVARVGEEAALLATLARQRWLATQLAQAKAYHKAQEQDAAENAYWLLAASGGTTDFVAPAEAFLTGRHGQPMAQLGRLVLAAVGRGVAVPGADVGPAAIPPSGSKAATKAPGKGFPGTLRNGKTGPATSSGLPRFPPRGGVGAGNDKVANDSLQGSAGGRTEAGAMGASAALPGASAVRPEETPQLVDTGVAGMTDEELEALERASLGESDAGEPGPGGDPGAGGSSAPEASKDAADGASEQLRESGEPGESGDEDAGSKAEDERVNSSRTDRDTEANGAEDTPKK